jgi:hypothetical protein
MHLVQVNVSSVMRAIQNRSTIIVNRNVTEEFKSVIKNAGVNVVVKNATSLPGLSRSSSSGGAKSTQKPKLRA